MSAAVRSRVAFAALAMGVVAPIAYAMQRVSDYAIAGEVDPLSMLSMNEVAFYWRCATAVFWGGLAAIVALFVAARLPDGRVERLAWTTALSAVAVSALFAVIGWFYP